MKKAVRVANTLSSFSVPSPAAAANDTTRDAAAAAAAAAAASAAVTAQPHPCETRSLCSYLHTGRPLDTAFSKRWPDLKQPTPNQKSSTPLRQKILEVRSLAVLEEEGAIAGITLFLQLAAKSEASRQDLQKARFTVTARCVPRLHRKGLLLSHSD